MNVGEMVVRFAADVANFTRGAQQVTESVNQVHQQAEVHMRGFTSAIKGGLSSILEFGAHAYQSFLLVQAGIQQVMGVVGGWIQGAIQAAQNQAQLNAVLKSTHDAVGMSAAQINAMVQNLKNLDGVDDDVILSGTNMLLTFTNIGSSVFPMANQAMLDMAVAMNHGSMQGLDLKDTAIQLGKALNDPINGITALSRVGVTFTQQQKDQIKAMVAAGNTAGAQKLILKELEREFGGAAAAAGNADPFNKFSLAMGDLGKAVGGILLPPLTTLANFITPLANQFIQWLQPAAQKVGDALGQLGKIAGTIFAPLGQLWQSVQGLVQQAFAPLATSLQQHVGPALSNLKGPVESVSSPLIALGQTVAGFAAKAQLLIHGIETGKGPFGAWHGILQQLGQTLSPLGGFVTTLWGDAQQLIGILQKDGWKSFQSTISDWGPIIQQAAGWFQSQMLPALMQLIPPVESLVNVIITKGVPAFFTVRDAVSHVAAVIASTLMPIFERVEPIVVKLAGYLLDLGSKALAFLLPKIQQAAGAVSDFATQMGTRLQPFIDKLSTGIQVAADIIQKVWGFLWPWMSGILKLAWDTIQGIISFAWNLITGLFKIGADILSGNWGQLWTDIKDTAGKLWGSVKDFVGNIWGDLKGLWKTGTGYITDAWGTLWNGLSGVASAAWDGVKSVVKDGINGAIDLLNKLIDAADHIPGVNIGHIPYVSFASGGVMANLGLAMVGEQGPELMMLPGGARIFNNDFVQQLMALVGGVGGSGGGSALQTTGIPLSTATSGGGGGSGTSNVTINLQVNGRTFAQVMGPELVAALRNAGVKL